MHGTPVGGGRSGHGLPLALIQRQYVIAHQGAAQLIGGPLRHFCALGLHQQIGVREAIPIPPCPGAEQPDPARQIAKRLGQPLLQVFEPTSLTSAAQLFEGTQFVASHALKLGADNGCRRQQPPHNHVLALPQAAEERLSLLTADRTLLGYGEVVRWVG